DEARLQPGLVGDAKAQPVARVERLGFNQPAARPWNIKEASISQDAVNVQEQQLDLAGAGLELFGNQGHVGPRVIWSPTRNFTHSCHSERSEESCSDSLFRHWHRSRAGFLATLGMTLSSKHLGCPEVVDMDYSLQLALGIHDKEGGDFPSFHEIQGFGRQLFPANGHWISCHGVRGF